MKILKKGKGWSKQLTCKGCKCLLEIDSNDISYSLSDADLSSQQYETEIEGKYLVECPECGLDIFLKPKDIPQVIRVTLKK